MNTQALGSALVIPVDKEHSAMRLTIVLIFIAIWIISFIVASIVIPNEGLSLLAVLLGFGVAYALTALLERFLKTRWPSGRVVEIEREGVKLLKKGALQQEMRSEDPVDARLWSFKISKRARVPKGWSMLACALEYENQFLTIYTFMSPSQLETFELAEQFKKLASQRKGKSDADAREDLRVAGEQRRLRDAENHRWMFGAEMIPADFIAYISRIKTQFPEWTFQN
ncbi:MAG: hypothetical protein ABI835_05455 [Chloroflexota bacterium]